MGRSGRVDSLGEVWVEFQWMEDCEGKGGGLAGLTARSVKGHLLRLEIHETVISTIRTSRRIMYFPLRR